MIWPPVLESWRGDGLKLGDWHVFNQSNWKVAWTHWVFSKTLEEVTTRDRNTEGARDNCSRKLFARRERFCTEQTFFFYIQNLSGKSLKFLDSFQIIWKVSRLSWTFLKCLESIEGLESIQIFWQVTKLNGKFPKCLESFHIVCNFQSIGPLGQCFL